MPSSSRVRSARRIPLGQAEVPRALRLEVAALDEVDERGDRRLELGWSVVAARALFGLLRPAAQDQAQEALALDLDRRARCVVRERRLRTLEACLRQAIGELEDDAVIAVMGSGADIGDLRAGDRRVLVEGQIAGERTELVSRNRLLRRAIRPGG